MNHRKAQYYIVKPLALIMTIIVLFMLMFSLEDFSQTGKRDAMENDMSSSASSALAILTNSYDCLAYRDADRGIYGNVIDYAKLLQFSQNYDSIEPECARSFYTGWHAVVEDSYTGEKWEFGAPEYSRSIIAKTEEMSTVITRPIAIRYTETNIKPGKIVITMYSGDLERLAGMIDYACINGRMTRTESDHIQTFYIEYPITNENGKLCMVLGKDSICRDMYCDTSFNGIDSDGEYSISVRYVPGEDRVIVRA